MDTRLASALAANGGVVVWDAGGAVPRWAVDDACRARRVVRVLPNVFVESARVADVEVRRRAALAYARGARTNPTRADPALSFTTALAVWGLLDEGPGAPVHVTVARSSTVRSRSWLVVHRPRDAQRRTAEAVTRRGLPVSRLEQALVEAWSVLPPARRREPVIRAVNERLTTAARIADLLVEAPRHPGIAELRRLVALLADGCRSELEIWGHDNVFTTAGMPRFARQVPVMLGQHRVYLDVFAERERVNFELDGASAHGSPCQRETDLRRDAALAAQGILVVRFTHNRLVREPDAVRSEVLAILAARRLAH